MQKGFFKKGFSIMIFVLFIGICFSPSISGDKKVISKRPDVDVFIDFVGSERLLCCSPEEWNVTLGGPGEELGCSVQQTSDGGYIITGSTESFSHDDDSDIWLVKTDDYGNELWNKSFGRSMLDWGCSVRQTSDEGFIITGWTWSDETFWDAWVSRTDSEGVELWNKSFGTTWFDWAQSVQETSDGGFILTGGYHADMFFTVGDLWLIKLDSTGNESWNKTFGGQSFDGGHSVQQTFDDGYIVAGTTGSIYDEGTDILLLKSDSDGNELWNKTYGYSETNESGFCARQTYDGGYILVGSNPYGSWLIKTYENGSIEWERSIFEGNCRSVEQITDGGFVLTGTSYRGSDEDVLFIRTDAQGYKVWNVRFDIGTREYGSEVQQTSDEGFIIVGTNKFGQGKDDVWLIKVVSEDTTPPETSIRFDPPEPDGDNGWFKIPPVIYLDATDDLSGVNHTYARIHGGSWQEVFGPIIFSGEDGEYTIYYRSVDKAGNREEIKSTTFKFDTRPPSLDLSWKRLFLRFFRITAICYDGGSGVCRVEFFIDDILKNVVEGSGPNYKWIVWWPFFKNPTLKVIAYDKAGYSSNNETKDCTSLNFKFNSYN